MRYFKFTYLFETTTGPPILDVDYGYQMIPTNKTKVRKIKRKMDCKGIRFLVNITHIFLIHFIEIFIFALDIFRILLCVLKVAV